MVCCLYGASGLELGRQLRETDWCRRQCRAALAADEQRSQLGAESSPGDAVQDEVDGVVQARQLVVEMRQVTTTTPISCGGGTSCIGVVEACNKIGRVRPSVRSLASTLRMVTRSVSPRFDSGARAVFPVGFRNTNHVTLTTPTTPTSAVAVLTAGCWWR